jgi:KDO2-lipid IV(A) lauroyltransferase
LAFIWSFLPWKANLLCGEMLAFLWFDVFKIRQKVIFDNLDTAFKNLSSDQKYLIAKKSTVSMCRSFFDVIKIPNLTEEWIQNQVVFHGLEQMNQLKAQNEKGFLFLTLHLGSGDLGAAVISQVVMPCTLITKRFRNQFLDQFWFSLRGRAQTEFIDAHAKSNAYEILGALKRKRGVIFVLDQFMGKPYGLLSRFFGKETGTAYGLALFAKKTQLPVIPIYTHWGLDEKLHIYFGERVALSADLSETNEEMTNKFNLVLEQIISQHPEHWMWVHRRWKKFE